MLQTVMWGMRAVAALGVVAIFLNYAVLKRLLAIVETVRAGDPFVAANAYRLNAIAWTLGWAAVSQSRHRRRSPRSISTTEHPFKLDAGFSVNGWLAVHPDVRAGAGVRRGHADARRPRLDGLTMAIAVKLDDMLHARRMTLTDLAERIDITIANLSILKTGKARAVRFSTLEAICAELDCQPGDLLEFRPGTARR